MSPKIRAKYGAAVAKDVAFDAVQALWRRRHAENWTRKQAADAIGADEGWFSKQFTGPRNWTMETFGALVQSLNGDVEIIVHAAEDVAAARGNYDAYAEMEDLPTPRRWTPKPDEPSLATEGTGRAELRIR